jgi:dolichol-phosphate mannosyltransferase
VLESIHLDTVRSHGYCFQIELTQRAIQRGFAVVEVPIVFRERRHGRSKMSPWIAAEAFVVLPQLRWRRGFR